MSDASHSSPDALRGQDFPTSPNNPAPPRTANADSLNHWNPDLYDTNTRFVSELGRGVVDLLAPRDGERILDIGCGTGDLTAELAAAGATPVGIDRSATMIERAREKYPHIRFLVTDATTYRDDGAFDAVFSNAALHWMPNAEAAARTVWTALRDGGRFAAEFGGQGNVQHILRCVLEALAERGVDGAKRVPWYFPSAGEYASLLERIGFRVRMVTLFDRPTLLPDEERGLEHWLDMFSDDFFVEMNEGERRSLYARIKDLARPHLYDGARWRADYVRIRVLAEKPLRNT